MKKKKRNFSSFDLVEAFKELQLTTLREWELDAPSVAPSEFYRERIRRLMLHFDTTTTERAKELLIDAICDEGLVNHPLLKVWKAASIQSDELTGTADYVLAPNRRYFDNPLLCVVEAKKDDFERGLAQCLVEMKACQMSNEQAGQQIAIYGIVTNGESWKFYRLTIDRQVDESQLYALGQIDKILGSLNFVFAECVKNIQVFAQAAKK